jgi:hypothetical protein
MPADRADDSYAIYSMLMPGREFASMAPEQTSQWAIASHHHQRRGPQPCYSSTRPVAGSPLKTWSGFQEAVLDYIATNRYVRIALTKDPFRLNHPFSLLRPDEVACIAFASRTAAQVSSEAQSQWSGFPGHHVFQRSLFRQQDTSAALVFMNDWCARLCSSGSWIYLEKRGGQWVRRSGITVTGGA